MSGREAFQLCKLSFFLGNKIMTHHNIDEPIIEDTQTISTLHVYWLGCLVLSIIVGIIGTIQTCILISKLKDTEVSMFVALGGFLIPLIIALIPVIVLILSILDNTFKIKGTLNRLIYRTFVLMLVASIVLYVASLFMMKKPKAYKGLSMSVKVFVYAGLIFDVMCLLSFIISGDSIDAMLFFF